MIPLLTGAIVYALVHATGADSVVACGLLGGLGAVLATWLVGDSQ